MDIVRESGVLLMAFCMGDYFTSLAWVDVLTVDARLKRVSRTMDAFLNRLLKEHEERRKMLSQDGDDQRDLLDVLLHLQEGSKLDKDCIKAIILVS